ncbi:hypothetical protein BBJ28_00013923 [Nothophytophthora sp. Chile5]|nr:hypothetical protein BBJ28_00013923 [Nothophytophthora sp. Chile5]
MLSGLPTISKTGSPIIMSGGVTLLSPDTYNKLQVYSDNSSRASSPHYVHDLQDDEDDDELLYQTQSSAQKILWGLLYTVAMLISLYFFIVSIKLIDSGFTLALGCNAKSAFTIADNPLAGLVIGTVATALLHSSSTVTSITVALVGTQGMTIRQGVYIVMGANVGTCVTCIIVAFGQVQSRSRFQRAMEAATVHTMFNIWSVLVLFPLEIIAHPLERLSVALSTAKTSGGAFNSPVDTMVTPFTDLLIVVDKKTIFAVAAGKEQCTSDLSLLAGGVFGGTGLSDGKVGAITVVLGFVLLASSLIMFVQMLAKVFLGPAKVLVSRLLAFNGYVNIVVGALITFVVQSSTVVTCTLTPMAGLGVFTLDQVYPLVLGTNLGTCGTALLASLVVGETKAVAVALVHLWFNVFGIVLFYPVPITRGPILSWARSMAFFSASWIVVGLIFVASTFLVLPGVLLGLEQLCTSNNGALQALGWAISGLGALSVAGGLFWYLCRGGRNWWHVFLELKCSEREERRRRDETAMLSEV